jgi:glycosyltransferase involved in cell wall biosynthesis
MDWLGRCAATIPCADEEQAIGPLVVGVLRHVQSAIVVDDGSRDRTCELAAGAGAQTIRFQVNQGKGAALRAGWGRARELGFSWVLTLDGDGQHSPEDIPNFFRRAEETSAELVVGNRMGQPEQMPWVRRAVNRWMSARLSKRAGQHFPDSQCGFRLINLQRLHSLTLNAAHFEIESEVILSFARAGWRIAFEPIRAVYQGERSKIAPVRDTWRWLRWWRRTQPPRRPV